MEKITGVFKALSDPTRLRLCYLLARAGREIAVCELIDSLEESQYNVSKHLKVLKNAGLVSENKKGRWVFYRIIKAPVISLEIMLKGMDEKTMKDDYNRLARRVSLRKGGEIVSCRMASKIMKNKTEVKNDR